MNDQPQEKPEIPAGYMQDAKGRLVPEGMVKASDKLEDQMVRKIMGYANDLSDQIARFKGHTFDDIAALMELLAEQYNVTKGGKKGNVTLTTFDGTAKVTVQIADRLTFGAELQIARELVDKCISKWAEGANTHIRTLVEHAFQTDKEGKINLEALMSLRRHEIDDDDWKLAMGALTDSIRVAGSKEYVRFYKREKPEDKWQSVTIDLAAA